MPTTPVLWCLECTMANFQLENFTPVVFAVEEDAFDHLASLSHNMIQVRPYTGVLDA